MKVRKGTILVHCVAALKLSKIPNMLLYANSHSEERRAENLGYLYLLFEKKKTKPTTTKQHKEKHKNSSKKLKEQFKEILVFQSVACGYSVARA